MAKKVTKGYKAFNKGLVCRGFQYEEGKIYETTGLRICQEGFHYCENPMDVLKHYPLIGSEFAEVEALGDIVTEDEKSATDKILIKAKLDLSAWINASVEFIFSKAKVSKDGNATSGYGAHSATSGNDAHSATSGEYAHSATSGNRANSATSGYGAHSATSGNDAIVCAVGRKSKAKASLGCFLVIAEWHEGETFTDAKPLGVYSKKVDGKKIKADQWYKIVDGKFVETDDSNE